MPRSDLQGFNELILEALLEFRLGYAGIEGDPVEIVGLLNGFSE